MLFTTVFPAITIVPGTWLPLCMYLIKWTNDPTMLFYEQINTVFNLETRGFHW